MDVDLAQLRALAVTVHEGTLDAAARTLHVTPSAVSQRLKALEAATGRVLLVRSRPVRPTRAGEVLLRLARQVDALVADAAADLDDGDSVDRADSWRRPPTLPVAVNADSLATWFLPAVAPLAAALCLDIHREDQDLTATLLRHGTVMAAVTADAVVVPGCRSVPLGRMRYRPLAAPEVVSRWFPDGAVPGALAVAPMLVFDRADAVQHRYLGSRAPGADPPIHYVPSSEDFRRALVLGLGWGMLPDLQSEVDRKDGRLVELEPGAVDDVALHWQQWKLRTRSLDRVTDAVVAAAADALLPAT